MRRWVLVTRPAEELADLAAVLARRGVEVVPYPVLVPRAVDDAAAWLAVREAAAAFRWLVLTSPRAAAAVLPAAAQHGLDALVRRLPAASVGERTAAVARSAGLNVEMVGKGSGAALAVALATAVAAGDWVLHPCGREHRPELAEELGRRGVRVVAVPVYAMELATAESLPPLPDGQAVAVLLTSPRAAAAYHAARGGQPLPCPHVAMGATTAAEAGRLGLAARALPEPNLAALEEELCRILS